MTSQCIIPTVDCVDVVGVDATTAHRVAGRIGAVECAAVASPLSAELAVVSAAPTLVTVLTQQEMKLRHHIVSLLFVLSYIVFGI